MTESVSTKLLSRLIENNLVPQNKYQDYFDLAESDPRRFEKTVIRELGIDEEELTKMKSKVVKIDYINLSDEPTNPQALKILSQDLALNYEMVVFGLVENKLLVGLVDPTNYKAIQAVEYLARKKNYRVKLHIISRKSFQNFVRQYKNIKEQVTQALDVAEERLGQRQKDVSEEIFADPIATMVKSAPVSKIVSVILDNAIEGRASDIHIEPHRDESRVRFRIDGALKTSIVLPIYIHSAVVSRIKVMANLKIDETRKPQDGRIRIDHRGKYIDFRVSILPLLGQEKVVMRVLQSPDKAPSFQDLGFMGQQLEVIKKNLKEPNGMFLVTGPTGSGKSTTLFVALNVLNKDNINITTLEDPIEYSIQGVNQSQIKPEVGFTFANGLRTLLRQDPDIIMVGEIRDQETAKLAINAALTGHFVLSTLHTNSAKGAIPRLIEMGVEAFLLGSTLNMILAQRLVRRICQDCKTQAKINPDTMVHIKRDLAELSEEGLYKGVDRRKLVFYQGAGCKKCSDTGYLGRLGISEVIDVDNNLREIIVKGFDETEADTQLRIIGFSNMIQDGWQKCLLGLTTVEEVLRVTKTEE